MKTRNFPRVVRPLTLLSFLLYLTPPWLFRCGLHNTLSPVPRDAFAESSYDVVLDAMFGFGFKGHPRPPFDVILEDLAKGSLPVVSVDVPSGWSVSSTDFGCHEGVLVRAYNTRSSALALLRL